MKKFLGAAILSLGMISNITFVNAGQEYKEEIDRFKGTKTATYKAKKNSECKLTKSLKSRLGYCMFFNSTESSINPSMMIGTIADGWELLTYQNKSTVPTIITYDDGKEEITQLSVRYSGNVLSGGSVIETVIIEMGKIKEKLQNIDKIEFQYGSAEYLWINDKELTSKAINFVDS